MFCQRTLFRSGGNASSSQSKPPRPRPLFVVAARRILGRCDGLPCCPRFFVKLLFYQSSESTKLSTFCGTRVSLYFIDGQSSVLCELRQFSRRYTRSCVQFQQEDKERMADASDKSRVLEQNGEIIRKWYHSGRYKESLGSTQCGKSGAFSHPVWFSPVLRCIGE